MDLESLKSERTVLKARLTRIFNQSKTENELTTLRLQLSIVKPVLNELYIIQTKIDETNQTPDEEQAMSFEQSYFRTYSGIQNKIEIIEAQNCQDASVNSQELSSINSDEIEINNLMSERTKIEAKLSRFEKQSNTELSNTALKFVLSRVEPLLDEFYGIQLKIDNMNGTSDEEKISKFETQILKITSLLHDKIYGQVNSQNIAENTNFRASAPSNVQLPTIKLPTFDGDYTNWMSFRDTYFSLIHENNSLPPIQKFHYLKSSLVGEAAKQIDAVEISATTYATAWKLLTDRFENKKLIIKLHSNALLNVPPANKHNLREVLDNILKHHRILEALKEPVQHWDTLLVAIVTNKLENSLFESWESFTDDERPTFKQLTDFLSKKCKLLEASRTKTAVYAPKKDVKRINVATQGSGIKCLHCADKHYVNQCEQFLQMSIKNRFELIKSKRACLNCFNVNHKVSECKSSNCKKCNGRHHTLLHFANDAAKVSLAGPSGSNALHIGQVSQVLLATALVHVNDIHGNKQTIRALLDSGSQCNLITQGCIQRLGLKSRTTTISINGINNSPNKINSVADVLFKSRFNNFRHSSQFLIMNLITGDLPSCSIDRDKISIPKNINLADPLFYESRPVEMLIGAEIFVDLLCIGQIIVSGEPALQKTKLGWVLSGRVGKKCSNTNLICNMSREIEAFWLVEELHDENQLTSEEMCCVRDFDDTYKRDEDGRFVVSYPLKQSASILGDSKEIAKKRFFNLERKLNKQPSLRGDYDKFMQEYLDSGHMKLADLKIANEQSFFLPHHAVLKSESITTKLRVVFDASVKSNNNVSLNDILRVGPVIQPDLFSLMLKFRTYRYAITADITKMYRQILINPSQTHLQRIFWRFDSNDPINNSVYELQTLTYGTASASYLATRCLQKLAELYSDQFPIGAEVLKSNFYVDDLIVGCNTINDGEEIVKQLTSVLNEGCFEIRKWASNEPQLLTKIAKRDEENTVIQFDDKTLIKTLGIQWNPQADIFTYSKAKLLDVCTKRAALSIIASIFDPLGIIGPIILTGKCFMQMLWKQQIGWDDELPPALYNSWQRFYIGLQELSKIKIPRCVMELHNVGFIELQGFADASEIAYGACLYVKTIDAQGNRRSHLLCSKSRVAPLKKLTIPRLELCGALLLAKLTATVTKLIQFHKIIYRTDSTIVLSWIKSDPGKFKTFVSNRIAQIQNLSEPGDWYHIRSADNPADILSRGARPEQLMGNKLWWHGPNSILAEDYLTQSLPEQNLPELKDNRVLAILNLDQDDALFTRYSNLNKLRRVVAYCLRFTHNCRNVYAKRKFGPISPLELTNSNNVLISFIQTVHFNCELKAIKAGNYVSTTSKLLRLTPFIDEKHNLIRVGGRLKHSDLTLDSKHPIVLPAKHPFTRLLIEHTHKTMLHAGPQGTLSAIRESYWILNGRNEVRKVIRNCVPCFRVKPKGIEYVMGDLPRVRVTQSRPFQNCGVDYGGPIWIKTGGVRSKSMIKAYIAVFVCLSTKAIHIELTTNLTSEAFIACLKRLMARRGKISNVYSDNATNFVGSNNELNELYLLFNDEISKINLIDLCAQENITWHFVPAGSPHFGGIWEAAIKSVKTHLKRVVGNASLTYEELLTVLVQIEGILNSRPLCPLSNDPNDCNILTPAHFLIGDSLLSNAEPNITNIQTSRLSRWQQVEQIRQHFWSRWSREYIAGLQEKGKWRKHTSANLEKGQLVLIREENTPTLLWPRGRVEDVHPGADGVVRVATIRTAKGLIKRTTRKLCPLPVDMQ